MAGQGVPEGDIQVFVRAHIRYAGTDTALEVEAGHPTTIAPLDALKTAFQTAHRQRFGFIDETKPLVIEAVSVEAVGGGAKFAESDLPLADRTLPEPAKRTRFFSGGQFHEAAVYRREQLFRARRCRAPR